jgi:ubiquinone/menaquinone biosynthesis C-methylase UbiE
MFSESAEFYDLIYSSFKDYEAETSRIATLIAENRPGARSILDVACGTAEHARLLVQRYGFAVDGLDLDPGFLEIARAKLPSSTFYHADMTSFELPRRYDVVLCLFSSIGYVRTVENVQRALACFRYHLNPGGAVILEPWFAPGVLEPGRIFVKTAESKNVALCRMSHNEVDGKLSRLRFEYLIGRSSGIERASEVHELGLFTTEEMHGCFSAAGLTATYDPEGISGRGIFVAREA